MTILPESVWVTLDDVFVEIRFAAVANNAGGVHRLAGSLWLERENLVWLRGAI